MRMCMCMRMHMCIGTRCICICICIRTAPRSSQHAAELSAPNSTSVISWKSTGAWLGVGGGLWLGLGWGPGLELEEHGCLARGRGRVRVGVSGQWRVRVWLRLGA